MPPNLGIKVILFQNYPLCQLEAVDVSSIGTENFILGLIGFVSLHALGRLHASWVCYFFVGILHPKVSWVHYCFTGAWTQLLWSRINIHLISMRTTQHSSNVPLVSALPSAFGSIRSSMDQRPIIKTLGG